MLKKYNDAEKVCTVWVGDEVNISVWAESEAQSGYSEGIADLIKLYQL